MKNSIKNANEYIANSVLDILSMYENKKIKGISEIKDIIKKNNLCEGESNKLKIVFDTYQYKESVKLSKNGG
ncbi:hypothetical protein OSC03_10820 [Morganella morganii]|nr:hypothetical protein [Morganella morganii]MDS0907513.1 hypothetical protein [Morganella morganii]